MARANKRTLESMQNAASKDKANSKKIVGKVSQFALKRAEAAEKAIGEVESATKKQRLESKVSLTRSHSSYPLQCSTNLKTIVFLPAPCCRKAERSRQKMQRRWLLRPVYRLKTTLRMPPISSLVGGKTEETKDAKKRCKSFANEFRRDKKKTPSLRRLLLFCVADECSSHRFAQNTPHTSTLCASYRMFPELINRLIASKTTSTLLRGTLSYSSSDSTDLIN